MPHSIAKFKLIIPARFESSRFPGKVLKKIENKVILHHVYLAASQSNADEIIIATDNQQIADLAQSIGSEVFFSKTIHHSGTERIAEVCLKKGWLNQDIIINLQADEPFINPSHINQLAQLVEKKKSEMATLASKIENDELWDNNCVKVILNHQSQALYFSRAAIPTLRSDHQNNLSLKKIKLKNTYRHIGIYAFRGNFLQKLVRYPSCDLEKIESLEQLRALYFGHCIDVLLVKTSMMEKGIDNEQQLKKIAALKKSKQTKK